MKPYYLALPFAALAVCAHAAETIKPGLWETNSKITSGNGKLKDAMAMAQQQLASMPADQRAKIEGMMARQGVVLNNDGVVAKVCITPAMAAKQQLPVQQRGNCSFQNAPPAGKTMRYSFTCTNPDSSGEGSATFTSPTSYTSSTRVTTMATGASEMVGIDSSGRWLAADCGAVKPMPQ
jgi:hypothetical protein